MFGKGDLIPNPEPTLDDKYFDNGSLPIVEEEIPIVEDDSSEEIPEVDLPDPVTEEEIPIVDEVPETLEEGKYLTLEDGVRSVLSNKLKRYNLDESAYNLAEMNSEELASFEEELDNAILENRYAQIKEVDPNLNKLLNFIEAGGDPKNLVSLFKESESIKQIDGTTEEGKVKKITSYYENVLKWDPEKVAKKIDRLKASDSINDEYEDLSEEYDKHLLRKQDEVIEKQERLQQEQEAEDRNRMNAFSSVLQKLNVTKQVKDSLMNTAFAKGKIKGSEEVISILDYKLARLKSNPETFLKLVQFVDNPEEYDTLIKQVALNKKTETQLKKGFEKVTSQRTSSVPDTQTKPTGNKPPFKF